MSLALAYNSSKLCHHTSKLGVRQKLYKCTVDYNETSSGYSNHYYATVNCLTGWPYTTATWGEASNALYTSPGSTSAYSACQIKIDHSHGDGSTTNNEVTMLGCWRGFLKPAEVSGTVTSGYLRIFNCGAVRHTINYNLPSHNVNAFAGEMAVLYDSNFTLELTFYADAAHQYTVPLTLSQIRTLNGANGVIAAGMGRYTYKMNGYIDVALPSQVLTILSDYTGIYVGMWWAWGNVQAGGYCPYCLGDYADTGYQSRLDACAVICTSNLLALNPDLYVS